MAYCEFFCQLSIIRIYVYIHAYIRSSRFLFCVHSETTKLHRYSYTYNHIYSLYVNYTSIYIYIHAYIRICMYINDLRFLFNRLPNPNQVTKHNYRLDQIIKYIISIILSKNILYAYVRCILKYFKIVISVFISFILQ